MSEEIQSTVTLKRAVQVGMVVRDVEQKMKLFSELFGIGPWRVTEWPLARPDMKFIYKGQETKMRMRLAFASLGQFELELIQPLEGENDYTRFLDTKGEGIHHILFDVQDMDATLAALGEKGIEVLQTGTGLRPGTRFVYLDTRDLIGFPLEMRNTVAGSDGSSPVPPAKATG